MSELSELYTPSATFDDGLTQLTYPWRDGTNYPNYYQSFTRYPERGTIDLSIFSFRRSNRSHALGSAITAKFARNAAGAHSPDNATLFTEVRYNNLTKNSETPYRFPAQSLFATLYPTQGVNNSPNTWDLYYHHQYSPNDLNMYNLVGVENSFFSIIKYNGLVLIPYFSGFYTDNNQRIYSLRYDQLDHNRVLCVLLLTYGVMYDGSRTPSIGFIQYAGKIPVPYGTGAPDGGIRDCRVGTDETCVVETMVANVLYEGQATDGIYMTPFPGDYGNPPGQLNFFDTTQCQSKTIVALGRRAWGISVEDCIMVLNELGYYYYLGDPTNINWQAMGTHCTDPLMYAPVIDENTHEVTTTVLHGTEIGDYAMSHPNSLFTFDIGALEYNGKSFQEFRESYRPTESTVDEADEIDLNEPVIATSGGNSVWLMNEDKLKEFFTYLWDPDGTIFDDIVKGVALLGENPMDSVVSCRFYPLDLAQVFGSKFDSQYRTICFGRVASDVTARLLMSSNVAIYELGSFYFNDAGMFNDFRDYEPYSHYSVYIPFVGIVPVSAIECINTTLSIKMIIDLITGACTAVVYTNGVPYKYLDGMIGIEVPVTGRNMAQYGQSVLQGALGGLASSMQPAMGMAKAAAPHTTNAAKSIHSWAGAQTDTAIMNLTGGHEGYGAIGSVAAGGAEVAAGAALAAPVALGAAFAVGGAALGAAAAALSSQPAPQSAGSNVPAMGLAKPLYPYFIVQRSESWIPENYAKLYGRPLQEGGKVGDFHGYSVFGNIKVEGIEYASNEEITLISELLTEGVYL